jgi:DNA polymerase IV
MLRSLVVDFNSYFASVEQQLNPALRGRPVGVVPMIADSTCLIAASYECKRLGVKTLTRVRDAKKLIPDIVLVEARHKEYVEFHELAVKAVDRVLPVEKVMSIDEMACELPTRFRSPEAAQKKALEIKQAIYAAIGECMHTSIGIAPNIFLAKQASNMQKPNGLTVITLDDLPQKLYSMKLGDLTGIGHQMLKRLEGYNIITIEQLWKLNKDQMHTVWGGVGGDDFYARLRGEELANHTEGGKSISHSHVLPPEMRNLPDSYAVLDRLTQKAAMRLRKANQVTGSMVVVVKAAKHYRDSESKVRFEAGARFSETQDSKTLVQHLKALLEQISQQADQQKIANRERQQAAPYQVGVVFGELVSSSQQTLDLFAPTPAHTHENSAEVLKKAKTSRIRAKGQLNQAVDALNVKFGKRTLYFGGAHQARSHGGMAIAFNHIPDIETEA